MPVDADLRAWVFRTFAAPIAGALAGQRRDWSVIGLTEDQQQRVIDEFGTALDTALQTCADRAADWGVTVSPPEPGPVPKPPELAELCRVLERWMDVIRDRPANHVELKLPGYPVTAGDLRRLTAALAAHVGPAG